MEPAHPQLSAHNTEDEPWRLARLARVDGRVRELMRTLTEDATDAAAPTGEVVWARHVRRLHDDRGLLIADVSEELADSAWASVVALVLARAWRSEDEQEVALRLPDGLLWRPEEMLPPLPAPAA
ncbi:MAG: hypothetical protein K2X11_01065 [Acetobacteraceae bacterium]|nr:hypothetical protein [Acetobacteraceae bacterium]